MKLELPEEKKLVHTMVMPIRWGDMDSVGHVNNALYFRYLESGRIAWFDSIQATPASGGDESFIIANVFCNFIHQLEYPGDIVVKTFISNIGRSSADTWHTIERTDRPGVIHATGGATAVWVSLVEHKSRPFPDWLRKKLEAAEAA